MTLFSRYGIMTIVTQMNLYKRRYIQLKKALNIFFIDGLNGMAQGLFSTLIIGTILSQIGLLIPGTIGSLLYTIGKISASLTGAGIGVGVARKLGADHLVIASSATVGIIGAFAHFVTSGSIISSGTITLSGPGEPLGAFLASFIAVEIAMLVSGKSKIDILLTPITCILSGTVAGLILGPPISRFMHWIGSLINWGTEQQPFIMGIVVAVIMGMALTLPISSAALAIILDLSGLAAGAATIGCCCNMVGFAVASYRENKFGGLIAQGLGTSMLQISNIVRKPVIWLPAILSSAILGPVGTLLLKMTNNATGAGMGTSGLIGQIMTFQTMSSYEDPVLVVIKIFLIQIILPACLTLGIAEAMRKLRWIKQGDMRLEV